MEEKESEPLVDKSPKVLFDIPDEWQEFLVCIIFHLLVPLFPIGIEYFLSGYVKSSTLAISASMYAVSIGISSKSILEFGYCFAGSILFAVMFGSHTIAESGKQPAELGVWTYSKVSAIIFISFVLVFHAVARYNRHVLLRQPFWEFTKKGGV